MKEQVFYKDSIDNEHITSLIRDVLNRDERVVFAYLYGSFVGPGTFFYDIDIAVYALANIDHHSFAVDLKDKIGAALDLCGIHGLAPDVFDIRIINEAPADIAADILADGLLVVSKNEEIRTSYIEHISLMYRLNQIVLAEALR